MTQLTLSINPKWVEEEVGRILLTNDVWQFVQYMIAVFNRDYKLEWLDFHWESAEEVLSQCGIERMNPTAFVTLKRVYNSRKQEILHPTEFVQELTEKERRELFIRNNIDHMINLSAKGHKHYQKMREFEGFQAWELSKKELSKRNKKTRMNHKKSHQRRDWREEA